MAYQDFETQNIGLVRAQLTDLFRKYSKDYIDARRSGKLDKAEEAKFKMIKAQKDLANFEARIKAKSENLQKNSYNNSRTKRNK